MNVPIQEEKMSQLDKTDSEQAYFGFDKVNLAEKQNLVNGVFNNVAKRYDLMNDLMSGGMHRLWKDAFVSWLSPPVRNRLNWNVLDVAGGTGDISFRILKRAGERVSATVCDINRSMLQVGQARAQELGMSERIQFAIGNAEALPFSEKKFDAYTIAFGIRNVPRIERALSEAYRVLKYGGRFLCLEFSEVELPVLDRLYDKYSFNIIPKLGGLIAGDQDSYRYLVESIRKFPNQMQFEKLISQSGFEKVSHRSLSGGIASIHSAWRL